MTRRPHRTGRTAAVGFLSLVSSCGDDTPLVLQPTLERPVAMAFTCADPQDGEPLDPADCTAAGGVLWALIANSTRGEVAVADVSTPDRRFRIRDLDPINPGFQMLSVGRDLSDIAVSPPRIGGRPAPVVAVTANAGSCDFGLVDVRELVASDDPVASTVVPTIGGVPLRARPHALAFVAGSASQIYATFPGCGLIGRLDVNTGAVLESLEVLADGTARAVAAPACPVECGPGQDPCPGGVCPAVGRPAELDMADDASWLVVTAGEGRVVVVALGAGGAFGPARTVRLAGAPDTGKIRISPETGLGRFAYVAASDGSVRVVSLGEFRECETNADVSADPAIPLSGCAPIGTTPRRPLSSGPGIDLGRIGSDEPVLPIDVVFSARSPSGTPGAATYYDGVFAYVLGSDGRIVVVDVEDRFYADAVPHTLRSSFSRHEQADGLFRLPTPLVGRIDEDGNRETRPPTRSLGEESVTSLARYPVLQPTASDPEDVGVRFAEPLRTPDDTVALVFEGVLPFTPRGQGLIEACGEDVCLRDPGAVFCGRGVEAGDLVELLSCTADSQCRSVERCYRDPSVPIEHGGLCVCDEDADPEDDECTDATRSECAALLAARREYTIRVARSGELVIDPQPPEEVPGAEPQIRNDAPLDADCFPSPVRYRVRARNALVLQNGDDQIAHRIVPDADGICVPDAGRSPFLQAKFGLDPPDCVDSAVPDPNPCRTRDLVRARHPLYDLTIARAGEPPPRGPETEFTITFGVAGSLARLAIDADVFLGAAIESSPDGFFYVLDQGDFIGGTARGQLRRLLPTDLEIDPEDDFRVF